MSLLKQEKQAFFKKIEDDIQHYYIPDSEIYKNLQVKAKRN